MSDGEPLLPRGVSPAGSSQEPLLSWAGAAVSMSVRPSHSPPAYPPHLNASPGMLSVHFLVLPGSLRPSTGTHSLATPRPRQSPSPLGDPLGPGYSGTTEPQSQKPPGPSAPWTLERLGGPESQGENGAWTKKSFSDSGKDPSDCPQNSAKPGPTPRGTVPLPISKKKYEVQTSMGGRTAPLPLHCAPRQPATGGPGSLLPPGPDTERISC